MNISDGIRTLRYLFGLATLDCLDAADTDDNGVVNLADAVRVLGFLFAGGPAPMAPYPGRGVDPTPDGLGCGP